jgi:methylated-DNA-protein-cysteine methyltransferase-like protein
VSGTEGFFQRVWALTERIPPGRVSTYGGVSMLLLGHARAARTVGWALHGLSEAQAEVVPWWRVINAAGRISTSCASHSAQLQAARLADEGVQVDAAGRVDLARYGWFGDEG